MTDRIPRASGRGLLALAVGLAFLAGLTPSALPGQTAPSRRAGDAARSPQRAPTHADIPYGTHPRQVLDLYLATTADGRPTPLLVFIHGGGWTSGDKARVGTVNLERLLDSGISVAAINYRYVTQADAEGVKPPVKWPLEDAARAVQFLRSRAAEWNLDPARVGATGGSAGACSSLWLALHDDQADPTSTDPIARQSTRLACAAVVGAQTSLDPRQMREWMPNIGYGGHAFGFLRAGKDRPAQFQALYDHREEVLPWIREYSPYEHAGPGDPPLFLDYPSQDKPPVVGEVQKDPTHSAVFGLELQKKLQASGVDARLVYPGHPDPNFADATAFLIAHLRDAQP